MSTCSVVVPSALLPAKVDNGVTNFGIAFPLSGVCAWLTDAALTATRTAASRASFTPHPANASHTHVPSGTKNRQLIFSFPPTSVSDVFEA
jgi:hypothetical protein